jgi:hypothetical protein
MTAPPVITRVSQLSAQLCIQKTKQLVLSFLKVKWLNKAKQSRSMKTLGVEGSDKVVVVRSQPANVRNILNRFIPCQRKKSMALVPSPERAN